MPMHPIELGVLSRSTGPHAWRRAIDAKYKLYTERALDPGDIYQAFLYAHGLGRSGSDTQPPTTVLIYHRPYHWAAFTYYGV
jgi:hypothetical protein